MHCHAASSGAFFPWLGHAKACITKRVLLRSKEIITKDDASGLSLWALPTTLSLDAPLIAICWQALFAKSHMIQLSWLEPCLLFLTVWLIYVADRLLDGFKLDLSKAHSARHAFYVEHRGLMTTVWLGVAGLTVFLAFSFLSIPLLYTGLITLGLCALYGLGVHRFKAFLGLSKEVQISFVFALGSALAVLVQGTTVSSVAMVLGFAVLCFLNCLVIAFLEKQLDAEQNALSLAQQVPDLERYLNLSLLGFAVLSFVPTLFLASFFCLALALAALALLALRQSGLASIELRRVLADAALLTPLFVLWF